MGTPSELSRVEGQLNPQRKYSITLSPPHRHYVQPEDFKCHDRRLGVFKARFPSTQSSPASDRHDRIPDRVPPLAGSRAMGTPVCDSEEVCVPSNSLWSDWIDRKNCEDEK